MEKVLFLNRTDLQNVSKLKETLDIQMDDFSTMSLMQDVSLIIFMCNLTSTSKVLKNRNCASLPFFEDGIDVFSFINDTLW